MHNRNICCGCQTYDYCECNPEKWSHYPKSAQLIDWLYLTSSDNIFLAFSPTTSQLYRILKDIDWVKQIGTKTKQMFSTIASNEK